MAAGGQEGGKEWRGGCAQGRRDVVKLLVIAALLCEMFALRVADADAQITLKRGYANTHTHTHTQKNTHPTPTLCRYSQRCRCRYTDTNRGQPGDPRKVSKCRSKGKLNIAHLIWQPFYFHVSSIPQGTFSGEGVRGGIHVNTTLKCRAKGRNI